MGILTDLAYGIYPTHDIVIDKLRKVSLYYFVMTFDRVLLHYRSYSERIILMK